MKALSVKQRLIGAAVILLAILFVVRPGGSRLKSRIIDAISRSVGHASDISSVHIRFLPRPGFDLENVAIYEDPAFGAEPMLRAPEVTAVLRLTSLLRGRLDISRLELTEPSLNLVRRGDGRWNWESLIERTAHTPLAPTAKSKSESRLGFPYIEASSGRINFKTGAEKRPYALLNANFALWQNSENTWGLRLRAQPLRTDIALSDTGLLSLNGSWQRAERLSETPLLFDLEWQHAQLGQMSKLVFGDDKGWRGEVELLAAFSGTPAALKVNSDASLQDFHRYDIYASDFLSLVAHCGATYNTFEGAMRDIFCSAPIGQGTLSLRGVAGRPGSHRLDLLLNAENLSLASLAQIARRAKKNIPPELAAAGSVHGEVTLNQDGISSHHLNMEGGGEISGLRLLRSSDIRPALSELFPPSIPFTLNSNPSHSIKKSASAQNELRLNLGPFPVALGSPSPAQARGWIGRSGFEFAIKGEGEVQHVLRLATLVALPAMRTNAEGEAQVDLQIAGPWEPEPATSVDAKVIQPEFISPKVLGTVRLKNIRAPVKGISGPLEIVSADVKLLPDEVRVDRLIAHAAKSTWNGSLNLARGCATPGACQVHFNLHTEQVDSADLRAWLSRPADQRKWYQLLSQQNANASTFLQSLRASGKLSATHLQIRDILADEASTQVELDHGKLKLTDLRAAVLGGTHRGNWQIDFTGSSPMYSAMGDLSSISLEQMAGAMHDAWISGTGDGSYQIKGAFADAAAFWESAEGSIRFDVRSGELAHVALPNQPSTSSSPLQVLRWQGLATIRGGKIEIEKSELASRAESYGISGSASLNQALDFKIESESAVGSVPVLFNVTGTLAQPIISPAPAAETRADLK